MKIAEFKIRLIFIFALSIALSSCSKSEDVVDSEIPRVPMVFSNRTPDAVEDDTKMGEKTSSNWTNRDSFGVYASLGTGFAPGGTWGDGAVWFLEDKTVTAEVTGTAAAIWTYDGIRYWPHDLKQKITFVAYHPNFISTTAGSVSREPRAGSFVYNASNGFELNFNANASPGFQEDLLYDVIKNATGLDPNGDGTGGAGTPTKFTFEHALSKVSLKVKAAQSSYTNIINIIITGVTLHANSTATFSLNTSLEGPRWSVANNPKEYLVLNEGGMGLAMGAVAEQRPLLLIPQSGVVTIDVEYYLHYDTVAGSEEIRVYDNYSYETTVDWHMAHHYSYMLTIGLNDIGFAVDMTEATWGNS